MGTFECRILLKALAYINQGFCEKQANFANSGSVVNYRVKLQNVIKAKKKGFISVKLPLLLKD